MNQIVLVGAGRIGRIHAANIAATPGLQLKAVIDPAGDAAADLASQYGAAATTIDAALTDPDVAGVVVASSTDSHVDYSVAAARANKAVLCEKPLAQDLDVARDAAAELARSNARVLLGFNRRFDRNFAKLQAGLASGAVGSLETLHIVSHDPAPPPIDYVRSSGGIFKDMVIHDFDMARWLLGEEPVQVFAAASVLVDRRIGEAGDRDTAKTILRTAGGRLCVISSSRRSGYGYDQRIEAFGSEGLIRAQNVLETTVETWGQGGAAADRFENFFLDRYRQAYADEMKHFVDVIAGRPPLVGVADGVAALALAEAAARSVESGRFEAVEGGP